MRQTYRVQDFSGRRVAGIAPGVLAGSLIVAFVLTILPLPEWAAPYRPYWTALIMIYWCLSFPGQIGVLLSWLAGLVVDILTGSPLGLHALGLAIIAHITLLLHRRARLWPLWQQAFIVTALLLNDRVIALWIRGLLGQSVGGWEFWVSPMVSGLLWPWIYSMLDALQTRSRHG